MNVIAFPQYIEVNELLRKHNVVTDNIDKEHIRQTIDEIRQSHGVFQEKHFVTVLTLLSHDWLPSDIPVLLPRRSI